MAVNPSAGAPMATTPQQSPVVRNSSLAQFATFLTSPTGFLSTRLSVSSGKRCR
jgi:hypothetical protein